MIKSEEKKNLNDIRRNWSKLKELKSYFCLIFCKCVVVYFFVNMLIS